MKKLLYNLVIILMFALNYNLCAQWSWITSDTNGDKFKTSAEIKSTSEGLWYSTSVEVYKYENGVFIPKNAKPIVEELNFSYLKKLVVDDYGNLIGKNNRGFAWLNDTNWNVIGENDINNILFNRGLTLTENDTLILMLISKELVKFWWDVEKNTYTSTNNLKLKMPPGQINIGTGGALIDSEDGFDKLLYSTDTKLHLVDRTNGEVENINSKVGFDTSIINNFYDYYESENAYYFVYTNKDSTASLLALDKGLDFPSQQFVFRHPEWDITEITAVTEYDNKGLIIALGNHLMFFSPNDTIIINRPVILGEDKDQLWNINSMDIIDDTLWVSTLSAGLFKAYIPDLLTITNVETPDRQWGLSNISILKTYPNPTNGNIISVDFYLNVGKLHNLEVELYDSKGIKISKANVGISNKSGNIYTANVDVSGLIFGMYFLKIKGEGEFFTKFIVN